MSPGDKLASLDNIYTVVVSTQQDVISTQKDVIATQKDIAAMQQDIQKLTLGFEKLNGTVRENRTDLAVLKDWRLCQADPATKQIPDIKLEVAKLAGLGGGVGLITSLVLVIAKVVGLV